MNIPPRPFRSLLPILLVLSGGPVGAAPFPPPYNSAPGNLQPTPPREALAQITVPPGLKATLFAAEPDVQNPIALTFDERGRLWVAENYTYAERNLRFDLGLHDRILIFEDTGGDGRATKRTVFSDSLQMLTSIAHGHGGVWAMCPPQLLFIPDKNADDVPDGPPQVVLDGFEVAQENYHNFANGVKWGPDGWLYGRCGASCPGNVGLPGTPPEQRVPLRGGTWRYHPQRRVFEALNSGTTNPWGHDWDEHGELFFINTVNGHLWHGITGAHFTRPHTIDPHPHVYGLIDQHADHYHFDTGKGWQASRNGAANDLGGGHAHCGTLIYQGDDWPAQWRGKLLTLNFHGRRINTERLERTGSGYVGKHEPDAVFFGDPWFRGLDLASGPDGGVFVLDWSDPGECHGSMGVHRTSGRIFKITTAAPRTAPPGGWDAARPLLDDLRAPNVWFARRSLLGLEEAAGRGENLDATRTALLAMFKNETEPVLELRAMWALQAAGGAGRDWLRQQLHHPNEHVRVWAIRLLTDDWPLDGCTGQRSARPEMEPPAELLAEFARLAREDASGLVRLTLASALQRLPVQHRAALAAPLLAHAEDADDHNLPLLVWYGLTTLADSDLTALVSLGDHCAWPTTRRFIARRIAEEIEKKPGALNALLAVAAEKPATFQADIIAGLSEAFTGWRKAPKPAQWDAFQAKLGEDASLRDRVRELSVVFGDGRALDEVKSVALDAKAEIASRKLALQTLVDAHGPELRGICEKLLYERYLNTVAIRGLAQESDPALGEKITKAYKSFTLSERPEVIAVLVTRVAWAKALLNAVAEGKVPRNDVSAFHARQIRNLNDAALTKRLSEVWGDLRETAESKRVLIAKLRAELTPAALANADPHKGRATFASVCAACHTLYGEGGKIGPDLTGANRDNLDYLLDNIADPSAVVAADFRLSTLTLKDGRMIAGIIAAKTGRTLTVRTMTDTQTVERAEIAKIEESSLSMMPDGLLEAFTPEQTRDLFAYLMSRQQVDLPEAK